MNLQINCLCGCVNSSPMLNVVDGDLSLWRVVAEKFSGIACPTCGCEHGLVDAVTSINAVDTAKPSIAAIDVASGNKAGGTAVVVTGHRLNTPGLSVKFGGVAATNLRNQTNSSATVDTPLGRFSLRTSGAITGSLAVGDVITGVNSAHTATIAAFGGGLLFVTNPTGNFTAGEVVEKDASNHVQLAASNHFSGLNDVSVSNANGSRVSGGTLVNAFTYTL